MIRIEFPDLEHLEVMILSISHDAVDGVMRVPNKYPASQELTEAIKDSASLLREITPRWKEKYSAPGESNKAMQSRVAYVLNELLKAYRNEAQ